MSVSSAVARRDADGAKPAVSKADLLRRVGDQYLSRLSSTLDAERFERLMMLSFDATPDLAKCLDSQVGRTSLALAAVTAAAAGLEVGTATREARILPRWNNREKVTEAQLVIEYKGYVLLASRNGAQITAGVVRDGDHFRYGRNIDGEYLEHEPALDNADADLIAAYAIARYQDGRRYVEVMGRTEVERHRDKSESYTGKYPQYSPWVQWPEAMWRKTAVRVLCRRQLDLSPQMADAIAADEAPLAEEGGRVVVRRDDQPDQYVNIDTPALEVPAGPEPDDDVVEAEIVEPQDREPPRPPAPTGDLGAADLPAEADELAGLLKTITDECRTQRIMGAARYKLISDSVGRRITSMGELTVEEAHKVAHRLLHPPTNPADQPDRFEQRPGEEPF